MRWTALFAAVFLSWIAWVPDLMREADRSAGAGAGFLLAIPSVLLAYPVLADQHPLRVLLLRGVRFLIWVYVACTAVAVAALLVAPLWALQLVWREVGAICGMIGCYMWYVGHEARDAHRTTVAEALATEEAAMTVLLR